MSLFRWFSRRAYDDERAAEMQAHIDLYVEELQALGRTEKDARREARLRFGNPRVKLEETDALNRVPAIDTLLRELRLAARSLRRSPSFTATVVAVLALAVGASTVVFSIVDTTILRSLPFDRADRLVALGIRPPDASVHIPSSAPHFLELRTRTDLFERVAAVTDGDLVLARDASNDPQAVVGQRVSPDFFDVLRVVPALGRFFVRENEADGLHHVAVISHGLWQRRFGGASDIIGRRVETETGELEIVGVTPPGFSYPVDAIEPTDIWTPYVPPAPHYVGYNLQPIARLRDGVSLEQALDRINDPATGVIASLPADRERFTTIRPLRGSLAGQAKPWLLMLLTAAACVLLVACVNIANLVLVRATVRTHELRIRAALGAGRWAIARSLLAESLLLSIAGTAVGLVLAWWGVDIIRTILPAAIPRQEAIAVDLRVVLVAIAAAAIIGVVLGLVPMLRHARTRGSLRVEQNRSNTLSLRIRWARSLFVVSEVALAVVLVVGAVLFLASYSRVMSVDLGVDYRNVLVLPIQPPARPAAAAGGAADVRERLFAVVDRIGALPGIESVAVTDGTRPLAGMITAAPVTIPGRTLPPDQQQMMFSRVSSDYFSVLGIPVLRGRALSDDDVMGSDAVIVLSQAAATRYFGDANPIGQVIGLQGAKTIVGVVGNVRAAGPEQEAGSEAAYVAAAQTRIRGGTLLVRARPGAVVAPAIIAIVRAAFPDIAIPSIRGLEDDFATYIAIRRFNMLLLTLFGLLGLTIAAIGIYGVMAYVVGQRTQEIGIRKALGAQPVRILWSVLGRALLQIAAGLVVGLSVAWMVSSLVESFLFRVEAHETALYAVAACLLTLVGIAAALVPARRAARVDPIVALRAEQ